MFCREQSARLSERHEDIESKGAQLIAIGNGRAQWAREFVAAEGIEFPVFVDPSRATYDAFGMKRGITEVASIRTVRHAARAVRSGFRQSATRGDPIQIGGVVIFDQGGQVIFTHLENEAGDIADVNEIIAALD